MAVHTGRVQNGASPARSAQSLGKDVINSRIVRIQVHYGQAEYGSCILGDEIWEMLKAHTPRLQIALSPP